MSDDDDWFEEDDEAIGDDMTSDDPDVELDGGHDFISEQRKAHRAAQDRRARNRHLQSFKQSGKPERNTPPPHAKKDVIRMNYPPIPGFDGPFRNNQGQYFYIDRQGQQVDAQMLMNLIDNQQRAQYAQPYPQQSPHAAMPYPPQGQQGQYYPGQMPPPPQGYNPGAIYGAPPQPVQPNTVPHSSTDNYERQQQLRQAARGRSNIDWDRGHLQEQEYSKPPVPETSPQRRPVPNDSLRVCVDTLASLRAGGVPSLVAVNPDLHMRVPLEDAKNKLVYVITNAGNTDMEKINHLVSLREPTVVTEKSIVKETIKIDRDSKRTTPPVHTGICIDAGDRHSAFVGAIQVDANQNEPLATVLDVDWSTPIAVLGDNIDAIEEELTNYEVAVTYLTDDQDFARWFKGFNSLYFCLRDYGYGGAAQHLNTVATDVASEVLTYLLDLDCVLDNSLIGDGRELMRWLETQGELDNFTKHFSKALMEVMILVIDELEIAEVTSKTLSCCNSHPIIVTGGDILRQQEVEGSVKSLTMGIVSDYLPDLRAVTRILANCDAYGKDDTPVYTYVLSRNGAWVRVARYRTLIPEADSFYVVECV